MFNFTYYGHIVNSIAITTAGEITLRTNLLGTCMQLCTPKFTQNCGREQLSITVELGGA